MTLSSKQNMIQKYRLASTAAAAARDAEKRPLSSPLDSGLSHYEEDAEQVMLQSMEVQQ